MHRVVFLHTIVATATIVCVIYGVFNSERKIERTFIPETQ